jgi:hypothetical protein
MTENEFWEITPRAFFNAIEGFESLRRSDLELRRLQTLYNINMWASKPVRDPKKLWTYHWEQIEVNPARQKELAHRAQRKADKFDRIEKRHGYK